MNWAWQPLLPAAAQLSSGGAVSVAITGVSSTTAVGSVTPSSTVALTGLSSTAAVGSLGVSISVSINGVVSTLSVGSLVPSTSVAFTGTESVAAVGTVGVSIAVPITGNVSTLSVGSVTVSIGGDVTVAISGVSSTLSVGSVTSSVTISEQPSGGGSWKPYRYLPIQESYTKSRDYDEEELKRRILEAEESNKEEIDILTRKSEQLYLAGKSIEEITNTVNVIQRQLEDRIQTQLLFDIKVELRLLELARKKKMALLLLMSAA